MEEIIKMHKLKDVITNTQSFIVWNNSVKSEWNNTIRDISNYMDKAFFINTTNQYNRDCGWYVKLDGLKPILNKIHEKIVNQDNYNYIVYMMDKYNVIIECINSEVSESSYLPVLKECNNNYCIFSINNKCCHSSQETVEENKLDCSMSIRNDYYELLKALKAEATDKIKYLELEELLRFVNQLEGSE